MSIDATEMIGIYTTKKEKQQFKREAKKANQSLSNYLRMLCNLPPNSHGAPTKGERLDKAILERIFDVPGEGVFNKETQTPEEIRLRKENHFLRKIIARLTEELAKDNQAIFEQLKRSKTLLDGIRNQSCFYPDESTDSAINETEGEELKEPEKIEQSLPHEPKQNRMQSADGSTRQKSLFGDETNPSVN